MSADNWDVCPRCSQRRDERLAEMTQALDAAYGAVPVEEFDRLRTEREDFANTPAAHTFREDYEFWGADIGELNASYRGSCKECGLTHEFKHHETFVLVDKPSIRDAETNGGDRG